MNVFLKNKTIHSQRRQCISSPSYELILDPVLKLMTVRTRPYQGWFTCWWSIAWLKITRLLWFNWHIDWDIWCQGRTVQLTLMENINKSYWTWWWWFLTYKSNNDSKVCKQLTGQGCFTQGYQRNKVSWLPEPSPSSLTRRNLRK